MPDIDNNDGVTPELETQWEKAKQRYFTYLKRCYDHIQVLGQKEPWLLERTYTDVYDILSSWIGYLLIGRGYCA